METNLFYRDSVLNIAHRGASASAPENTLPAFRLAADLGADAVELDVQLSQDGEAVIMHNFTVDDTTDGHGAVKAQSVAALKTLDAGSHFSAQFAGTPIPTLQEVLTSLGPVLLFNIELKTASLGDDGLEAETIRLVEDFGLQDRVALSSFNPFSLMRAYRVNPKIKRGLLWCNNLPFYLRWRVFQSIAKPDLFHPCWQAVTPKMLTAEHERGRRVNVWTCNEPDAMRRLIKMGVDGIITDHPERLKQVLDAG